MSGKTQGFQFKQFYIEHSQCAMKVGTDSIMLGSWIEPGEAQHILDIGTGSGLLAIMLAQKTAYPTQILGIDIDHDAIYQAQYNANNTAWSDRLTFDCIALQALCKHPKQTQLFDLIVSNPPYFAFNSASNQQHQLQTHSKRIQARQTASLDHLVLLNSLNTHLSSNGCFYCVLPADNAPHFIAYAAGLGLHNTAQLQVQSQANGKIVRVLLKFSRYFSSTQINQLTIYHQGTHYSQAYIDLCQAYYLRF